MKFSQLKKKRLIGFRAINMGEFECHEDYWNESRYKYKLLLFFGKLGETVDMYSLESENKDYCHYTSWTIKKEEVNLEFLNHPDFKFIGEKIKEVWIDGIEDKETYGRTISADYSKWKAFAGTGGYDGQPTPGVNYVFISIRTDTKNIDLGTCHHDCHYPESIWEFI